MTVEDPSFLKVKLQSSIRGGSRVVFRVSPDIVENRTINYKAIDPVHMPGQIHVFTNTSSRTYALNSIRLISRTSEEATKNLWAINVLRHWATPYFSKNSSNLTAEQIDNNRTGGSAFDPDENGKIEDDKALFGRSLLLGAPPDVLYLSAYSEASKRGNIYKVPVVLTSLSIPYPSDVDYIPTAEGLTVGNRYRFIKAGVPFPTIMTLDITTVETHSPNEYNRFNIYDFRNGRLDGF